jgi:flagellar biosynthetic protein FliR
MLPAELLNATAFAYLRTVTRLAFALQMLPVPGVRQLNALTRVAVALVLAAPLTLTTASPASAPHDDAAAVVLLLADAAAGLFTATIAFLLFDALSYFGQLVATQCGFTYGATIDPLSEVDSGLLPTLLGLGLAACFYTSPLFPSLVLMTASRADTAATVTAWFTPASAAAVAGFAKLCCVSALGLAVPIAVLALLTDLVCALIARHLPQLQVLSVLLGTKPLVVIGLMAMCLAGSSSSLNRLISAATKLLRLG